MYCQKCGKESLEGAQVCAECGAELQGAAQPVETPQSTGLKTSPMAIWSLVLGILGWFTCLPVIPGVILGILGLKQVREKPREYTGSGLATAGIVVSAAGVIVFAVVSILAAILFPVFARAREAARKSQCMNNLKQCSQALKMYADDYDGKLPSSAIAGISGPDFCSRVSIDGHYPPSAGEVRKTWPQLLSDHIRSQDIVYCSSDSAPKDGAANRVASYWYKYANDVAWTRLGKQEFSDYGYEADQIAFFEYKGWHFGDQTGLKQGIQINVVCMDTHVETVVLPVDGTAPPATAPVIDPSGMTEPYEPFYYNTRVDQAGNAATVTDRLSPDISTGACIDPASNYDSF